MRPLHILSGPSKRPNIRPLHCPEHRTVAGLNLPGRPMKSELTISTFILGYYILFRCRGNNAPHRTLLGGEQSSLKTCVACRMLCSFDKTRVWRAINTRNPCKSDQSQLYTERTKSTLASLASRRPFMPPRLSSPFKTQQRTLL